MESKRLTITIDAGSDILASVANDNFHKPCPKSKRKPISSGFADRGSGTSRATVTAAAEPSTRVEVGRAGATKNESSKRRKAVPAVVQRSRSPVRRTPMPTLPYPPKHQMNSAWKKVPPIPKLTMATGPATVRLTWEDGISLGSYHLYAVIAGHEMFACVFADEADREDARWEKLTFVKALPPSHNRRQPVSCEITNMVTEAEYYFAVRPVDVHDRRGPFAIVYAQL